MKLEGLSDRAEANLEDRIRHLYVNSGPQYVIDVLKVLRKHTESQIHNPNHTHRFEIGDPSIAWDHKTDRPKHGLGILYKKFPNPLERLRVIRAVENTIVFETASKKQLQKAISGVRSKTKNDGRFPIRLSDKTLRQMERALAREVVKMQPFSARDLTGDMLPYAHLTVSIGKEKSAMKYYSTMYRSPSQLGIIARERAHDAARKLDSEAKGQFYTAPRISKHYWNRIVSLSYEMTGKDEIPEGILYPRKVTPRPIMARDYEIKSYNGQRLADRSAEYDPPGTADYLGRFDFLQQEGGKLRSVANVNRYVNYTLEPYAKMLEKQFYGHPSIEVLDQQNGLRWVQSKFRSNQLPSRSLDPSLKVEIESIDLTSATDLLDFRVFTSALKRDFPGKTGLLEAYASYFEELSSLPLYCEPLESPIQFSTGQPLGMKGSFQTLTIMNAIAGIMAARHVGLPTNDSFRVVGDDFICDSRIAPIYHQIVKSWGGKTNEDKAMKSYTHGEFLSKIVTANHVYTIKPKYRLGKHAIFINAEKAKKREVLGLYRLSKDEREYLDILSEYSTSPLDSRTSLPRMRSISTKISNEELEWVSNALQILADARGSDVSEDISLSRVAIEMLHREKEDEVRKSHAPIINEKEIASGPVHLEEATFPTGTDKYNHRSGRREQKQSLKQVYDQYVSRAKDIKKIKQAIAGESPNEPFDIGYGMTLKVDNVVLAAIPDKVDDSRRSSSEYLPTRQPSKINSLEAFQREIEDDGPDL